MLSANEKKEKFAANDNNIYPGSPLALAVFSGALQIINDKMPKKQK